jgi:L-Ala-D/L-Glu epimerase
MKAISVQSLELQTRIERWPLTTPFRITGYTFESFDTLFVSLSKEGVTGQAEAAGVYYKGDIPELMQRQIEALRGRIEAGLSRDVLQAILPPGGARNALDCALWDLEAKLSGLPAWRIAELSQPKPLLTTFTCSADTPERMAQTAAGYRFARALKIKLTGESSDADRIEAIREVRPDAWLGVDANQAFTRQSLAQLMPIFLKTGVSLIEQPFPIGQEMLLDGLDSPIPIAADESLQCVDDIPGLVGRVDVLNIKLDKCGGLTEGLAMARRAQELGMQSMVGCMMSTSLAIAPAFVLGQCCAIVDLDGPLFLTGDRDNRVQYADGRLQCPSNLWGN